MLILTINGDPVCEGSLIFEGVMYFSIFYCLCFVGYIRVDIVEEQVMEEIEPYLKGVDTGGSDDRDEHWKEV